MQTDCFPDICSEWEKDLITVLADVNPRYKLQRNIPYPFVEMASVLENFGGIVKYDTRKMEGSGLSRFKENDTLFAKITPCPENGKVAYVTDLPGEFGLGSTEFIVLRPKDNTDSRFLYHLLCSHEIRGRAIARMEGSTGRQRVTEDVFTKRLVVPVPPSEEQEAIARILDAVDAAIERTRKAVETAQILGYSLLNEFLDHGINGKHRRNSRPPAHWKTKRVDEVATVGSGVTLGKDVSGFKSVELPYLRVANVQDGHLDLTTVKTVSVRVVDVDRYRLEPGDVLMTEGGDLDKLGRGTIWEGQIPNCLHQNHIFRVRANRELLDPRFFAYVVESNIAKSYFLRVAKRTTNLASTNKTQVRAFRFPVPPLSEQKQIAEVIGASKAILHGLVTKEKALQQLKKSLMHDLLTGKVRVTALLEKVGAAVS